MGDGIHRCTLCPADNYCKGLYPVCIDCIQKHGSLKAAQEAAKGAIMANNVHLNNLAHTLKMLDDAHINIDNLRELVNMTPYQIEKLRNRNKVSSIFHHPI